MRTSLALRKPGSQKRLLDACPVKLWKKDTLEQWLAYVCAQSLGSQHTESHFATNGQTAEDQTTEDQTTTKEHTVPPLAQSYAEYVKSESLKTNASKGNNRIPRAEPAARISPTTADAATQASSLLAAGLAEWFVDGPGLLRGSLPYLMDIPNGREIRERVCRVRQLNQKTQGIHERIVRSSAAEFISST